MKIRKLEDIVQDENRADEEIDSITAECCCPDCDRNQSAWDEYQSRPFVINAGAEPLLPYPALDRIDVEREVSRFFEAPYLKPTDKPTAVLLVGPICTGKTTIRNSKYSSGFVLLDAGEIFLKLTGSSEPRFPGPLQETIWMIGQRIFIKAAKLHYNLVTEVLGTDSDVMIAVIEALKAYGYVVEVAYIHAELEQCVKRKIERGDDNLSAYFTEGFHYAWILGIDPPGDTNIDPLNAVVM